MGIYNGIHQVARFKSGDLWHFYSKKDKGIFFRRLGENGAWQNPIELIINTQEDFSLNIDKRDHLHLICRSNTGEILYMKYEGKLWSKQILSRFEPSRYNIKYPSIIIVGEHIHILFAIGTTFNTGYWSLYHYHWDENKWNSTEITKFTAGQRISPFYTERTDKHIHLVYRGLHSNRYQIFHCRFHIDHGIWSVPENATHSMGDCNMPSMLMNNNQLHLVWVSLSKSDLTVKYRRKTMNNSKLGWSEETSLSTPGSNCNLPFFIFIEGKLWCIWSQNDVLFYNCSEDEGVSWGEPQPLDFEKAEHYYLVNYTTNYADEMKKFKLQRSLGCLDINLQLPILQDYIDLPKYSPSTPPTPWEPNQEGIVSTLMKDIRNPGKRIPDNKVSGNSAMQGRPGTLPPPVRESYGLQAYEQIILKELERQEEHSYSIISKLDDLMLNEEHSITLKEIKLQLLDNTEKLQTLSKSIAQLKDEITKLQSQGFMQRIFSFHSKKNYD